MELAQRRVVITDVNFDKFEDRDDFTSVQLSSRPGFIIHYPVLTLSRNETKRDGFNILRADLIKRGARRGCPHLKLEIHIDETGSLIVSRVWYSSTFVSDFQGHITEDAKRKLINFFKGPVPVDASTLPKVKVPKGQADNIFWAPIEDGTVMADFKNERDGFHRYYTKAGMDRMNPLINMGTNLPLQQSDITYYIAELDDSMQPTFTGNADGGRRRKTRRRTPRNNRRST